MQITKEIANEWQINFTNLTPFGINKFYKIIGPFVYGIELLKLPFSHAYRPQYVFYALWGNKFGNSLIDCLRGPTIIHNIKNKKGFQFDIPYSQNNLSKEAIECTKMQLPIPIVGDVNLHDLFMFVNKKFNDTLIKNHSGQHANLYQFMLFSAGYIGKIDIVKSLLSEIKTKSSNWNMQQFELAFGNYENWYANLQTIIKNRDEFVKSININLNDPKLVKFERSDLI